jgi:hypothetical protein
MLKERAQFENLRVFQQLANGSEYFEGEFQVLLFFAPERNGFQVITKTGSTGRTFFRRMP